MPCVSSSRRPGRRALALLAALTHCVSGVGPRRPATVMPAAQASAPSHPVVPPPARPSVAPTAVPTVPAVDNAFGALPGWRADHLAEAVPAWRRTCERLLAMPDATPVGRDARAGLAGDWKPACRELAALAADDAAARAYFERWFEPVRVAGDETPGLFTGYFEPELRGSRTRHGAFTVPLYAAPTNRRGRRPYFTRAQIAAGALARRGRTPIVWVDDAVDAFFLEIQGSGRVALDDGQTIQLNYAASNGRPYVALGQVLVARGALERAAVSLQSIRAWLLAHPREAQRVMNANPSYVFFRESAVAGARGAAGVVLTPGRSLAMDPRYVPLGVPMFLDVAPLEGVGAIQRLVVAQDTGGAIRGAVRGDVFWGTSADAYDRAGRMRQAGRYWMLLPRGVRPEPAPS
jgi:membrane-bound lytic murein transglycosylase A